MLAHKRWVLVLVLEFIRIFYCTEASNCSVTATQPPFMEAETSLNSVTIPCNYSSERCGRFAPKILWLRFLAHTHEVLCDPTCTNTTKFKVHPKTSKHENLLEINHLSVGDSAIYVCGIASTHSKAITSKQTGNGTVLVVRDRGITIPLVIISLLILYLIALLAIFMFLSKPKLKPTESGGMKGKHNAGVKESREAVCRAVAKEFLKKKRKQRLAFGNHQKTDKPS
ncbi:immunoglobulin superfamily member 6 [Varanus komodoensis]|uniref:immunoglobulin superfamily member 6 n=1 Tax=Varanus komodoensis TaxID=61221 RepID=UPI001CF7E85B|nr:immunoglobulin superfamily member 6 [Varanus komodoensis]